MRICKKQYRIVKDNYLGFEVQKRVWYFPFWRQIRDDKGSFINTSYSIEEAEQLIDIDRRKARATQNKVVKVFDCEN